MASATEIANRALVKLGESRIADLSDNSKPARTINSLFERVRDAEMRKRRWSFTLKRTVLAADAIAPAFGYSTQYTLPVDCLRPIGFNGKDLGADLSDYRPGSGAAYAIEGRKILTGGIGGVVSPTGLQLRYIAAIADTTLWDACFIEAFACKCAIEACETLTASSDKRRLAWQEYKEAVADGVRANAIELPSESLEDDTWVMARLL